MVNKLLLRLFEGELLNKDEADGLLRHLLQGGEPPAKLVALMSIFRLRPITVAELDGFRSAVLNLSVPIDLGEGELVDICGTGGDGKDTFNISTLAAIVTAAAGVRVVKHGNYGFSSSCGSSNVLEAAGVRFSSDVGLLKRCLDEAGICFLHAPLFHPALKSAAALRKEFGIRSFFNLLGPLVNPARPKVQVTGVSNPELQRLYGYVLDRSGQRYSIVYALDGYDEVSLTGKAKLVGSSGEVVLGPGDFGLQPVKPEEITVVGGAAGALRAFNSILAGQGTQAEMSVVLANSAVALKTFAPERELLECVGLARETLLSGKALAALDRVVEVMGG